MEVVAERGCGLDVHEAQVTACLLVGKFGQRPKKEVKQFGTATNQLEALRDWLRAESVTHVGMESTGIYWEPVYAILEGHFELIVGNAQHIKNVPGRKTDIKDSEWLADLVRHGLIRKSYVPPKELRELRVLTRYRAKLVGTQTAERNRLMKVLETANIKLSSVVSDVFGASGRLMLDAIIQGEAKPEQMAELAKGTLRNKIAELTLALNGRVNAHHRGLLQMQRDRIAGIEEDLDKLDQEIKLRLAPYNDPLALLITIPGVDHYVASTIIAEIGADMAVFPTAKNLARWAGLAPGNNESAGRRRSGRITPGNPYLKAMLVQAAHSMCRSKGTYFGEKFRRLRVRRGAKRAAVAIAHKMLIATYHVLSQKQPYRELGEAYLDAHARQRTARQLVARLKKLGYAVDLPQQQEA